MKMAFYRESCTIVVNIITELKPVFKDRRKHVIKDFNESFEAENSVKVNS